MASPDPAADPIPAARDALIDELIRSGGGEDDVLRERLQAFADLFLRDVSHAPDPQTTPPDAEPGTGGRP